MGPLAKRSVQGFGRLLFRGESQWLDSHVWYLTLQFVDEAGYQGGFAGAMGANDAAPFRRKFQESTGQLRNTPTIEKMVGNRTWLNVSRGERIGLHNRLVVPAKQTSIHDIS